MIYEYILPDSWATGKGKTPSLIIALRGDSELYHAALKVFYKSNTFAFTKRNYWMCTIKCSGLKRFWDLGKTSQKAMATIKHASFKWSKQHPDLTPQERVALSIARNDCLTLIHRLCKEITHLTLEFDNGSDMHNNINDSPLLQLPHIQSVRMFVSQEALWARGNMVKRSLTMMNDSLDAVGRPISVVSRGPLEWGWVVGSQRKLCSEPELSLREQTNEQVDKVFDVLRLDHEWVMREGNRLEALGLLRQSQEWDDEVEDTEHSDKDIARDITRLKNLKFGFEE